MPEASWHQFDGGATVGQKGSEDGAISRDEEHSFGARITLERDTPVAPFAIICGIYGWMVHTRFFGLEGEASLQYGLMKDALSALLEGAASGNDVEGRRAFSDGVAAFVEAYP